MDAPSHTVKRRRLHAEVVGFLTPTQSAALLKAAGPLDTRIRPGDPPRLLGQDVTNAMLRLVTEFSTPSAAVPVDREWDARTRVNRRRTALTRA